MRENKPLRHSAAKRPRAEGGEQRPPPPLQPRQEHRHEDHQGPIKPDDSQGSSMGLMKFPYRVEFNDHFETSIAALQDFLPVVNALRSLVRPNCPELFSIYDPYYCAGAVKRQWISLGFTNVFHEKRDFYEDVKSGAVPDYDILVTNPPYSGNHMERALRFAISSKKPWAMLLPDYVATKEWYVRLVEAHFEPNLVTFRGQNMALVRPQQQQPHRPSVGIAVTPPPWLQRAEQPASEAVNGSEKEGADVPCAPAAASAPPSSAATEIVGLEPFYVVPKGSYDFKHPTGAGHAHSHFKSMWYVWCGRRTNDVLRAVTCSSNAPTGAVSSASGGGTAPVAYVSGLARLRDDHHVRGESRPNPRAREQQYHHHSSSSRSAGHPQASFTGSRPLRRQ